jgi:hypothetical protein
MLNLQSVYLGSSSQPLEASEKTRIALDSNGVVHVDRGGNTVTLHWDVRNAVVVKGEGYDDYLLKLQATECVALEQLSRDNVCATDGLSKAAIDTVVGVMPGAPGARPPTAKR